MEFMSIVLLFVARRDEDSMEDGVVAEDESKEHFLRLVVVVPHTCDMAQKSKVKKNDILNMMENGQYFDSDDSLIPSK